MSIWIFFRLIGALALLMFGMKTMSDSLQKMAGPQLRHVLGTMTTNRVTGILSGTLITAAVQSSTATTVMTVSFVNAHALHDPEAIAKRQWIVDNYDPYLDGNVCQRMLDGAEDYIRRHGVPSKRHLNLWRKYTSIKTFGRIKRH